jgi:hypothetical protein
VKGSEDGGMKNISKLTLRFFDAMDRFKCYLGLELTRKILALRFAHHLLLFSAGYYLNSLSENWGPLYWIIEGLKRRYSRVLSNSTCAYIFF